MKAESVRGMRVAPIVGRYTPRQALSMMLKDLRLQTSWRGASTVTVAPMRSFSPAPTSTVDPAPNAPEDSAGPIISDNIVVTARRSAESIQSVPVTATAFGSESLKQASINQTSDLMMKTPGVFLLGSNNRENPVYVIRGQSKALSGTGAPAVVSYFAEVPSPVLGSSSTTYDMSSVQVLKGPQGTLFGRNTTGGAVLYYPTAPSYDLGGYVEASYGRYDNRQLEGALTLPVVDDHIALRIAAQYHKQDNYTKNLYDGGGLDGTNSRAYRASLLVEPFDGLSNTTIFDYYRNRYDGEAVVLDGLYDDYGLIDILGVRQAAVDALAQQQANGPRVVSSDVPPLSRARKVGVTNRTEWKLGDDVSLVNIFGYRHNTLTFTTNVDGVGPLVSTDGTPFAIINASFYADVEQYSDEVQLKGSSLGGKLDWIVGGFWLKSDPVGSNGINVAVATVPGVTHGSIGYNFNYERSKALFGNVIYKLDTVLDGLKFNAGFRYTWDKITACTGSGLDEAATVEPDECLATNPDILLASTNTAKSSAPTWQVGFDWQVNRNLFTYITSRRGYRAGGINGPTLAGPLVAVQSYDPETITDLEVGVRSEWRIGSTRLKVNASAYVGNYDGVQLNVSGVQSAPGCVAGDPVFGQPPYTPDGDCISTNDPTGGALIANAGKARISGLDFDTLFAPTERLSFTFGGSLLHTSTRSISSPAVLAPYVNQTKIPFILAAKSSFTAGAQYRFPMGPDEEIVVSGDYYHSSKRPLNQANLDAYDLANFRVSWNGIGGLPADLSVYMTNAFGENYSQMDSLASSGVGLFATVHGAPRQYGLSLRYRFGK